MSTVRTFRHTAMAAVLIASTLIVGFYLTGCGRAAPEQNEPRWHFDYSLSDGVSNADGPAQRRDAGADVAGPAENAGRNNSSDDPNAAKNTSSPHSSSNSSGSGKAANNSDDNPPNNAGGDGHHSGDGEADDSPSGEGSGGSENGNNDPNEDSNGSGDDNAGSGSSSTGPQMSIDQFANELEDKIYEAICKQIYECMDSIVGTDLEGLVYAFGRADNRQSCADRMRFTGKLDISSSLVSSKNAGRLDYHPGRADQCISELEQTVEVHGGCGLADAVFAQLDQIEACREATSPDTAQGDYCLIADDCRGEDAICASGATECHGTCRIDDASEPRMAGRGQTCSQRTCAGDLLCEPSRDGPGSICILPETRSEGSACTSSNACRSGLTCPNGGTNRTAQCTSTSIGAKGATCDYDDDFCKPGLTCRDLESGTGTCREPAIRGESCLLSFQCEIDLYCKGANPNTDRLGTCKPQKPNGATCSGNSDFDPECRSYMCHSNTCVDPDETNACRVPSN